MLTEQEKKKLKTKIQSNKHQIYVVSMEQMDAIIHSSKSRKKSRVKEHWAKLRAKVEFGANYTASTSDIVTLSKLIGDLGGIGVKAYVKSYKGKPHIILKGRPGLRKILTGTKYGIKNPKVITMGLGRAGAVNAARMGGIISIVLLTAFRVADYVLTDKSTLTKLVGNLAVDIVKVGITTGVGIVAAHVTMALTTIAIGPILAVVAVGIGLTYALNAVDERYGLSKLVVAGLDELSDTTIDTLRRQKQNIIDSANNAIDSVIDYAVESAQRIIINFAQQGLRRFLSNTPRLL